MLGDLQSRKCVSEYNQHSESSPVMLLKAHPVVWATYQNRFKPSILLGRSFPVLVSKLYLTPCILLKTRDQEVVMNMKKHSIFRSMNNFSLSKQPPEVTHCHHHLCLTTEPGVTSPAWTGKGASLHCAFICHQLFGCVPFQERWGWSDTLLQTRA